MKALALQNFQNFNDVLQTERTDYGDTLPDGDQPVTVSYIETGSSGHNQEFVYGMEIRAEAAFQATRDLSLSVGFNLLDLAQGIGRSYNPEGQNNNSQDVIMYGVTFGAMYNR